MTQDTRTRSPGGFFRGTYVWAGLGFAVVGSLCERFIGGQHSFEFLLFFGGLFIGVGYERNRLPATMSAGRSSGSAG